MTMSPLPLPCPIRSKLMPMFSKLIANNCKSVRWTDSVVVHKYTYSNDRQTAYFEISTNKHEHDSKGDDGKTI